MRSLRANRGAREKEKRVAIALSLSLSSQRASAARSSFAAGEPGDVSAGEGRVRGVVASRSFFLKIGNVKKQNEQKKYKKEEKVKKKRKKRKRWLRGAAGRSGRRSRASSSSTPAACGRGSWRSAPASRSRTRRPSTTTSSRTSCPTSTPTGQSARIRMKLHTIDTHVLVSRWRPFLHVLRRREEKNSLSLEFARSSARLGLSDRAARRYPSRGECAALSSGRAQARRRRSGELHLHPPGGRRAAPRGLFFSFTHLGGNLDHWTVPWTLSPGFSLSLGSLSLSRESGLL